MFTSGRQLMGGQEAIPDGQLKAPDWRVLSHKLAHDPLMVSWDIFGAHSNRAWQASG